MGRRGPQAKDDGLFKIDFVILFCSTQYQQVIGRVGEMRSTRAFLFSRLFLWCEHARLTRISQHCFGAGDAVKWNIRVSLLLCGCEHDRLARISQHRFGEGVFLVSAKKGAIIYPGDFFQRPLKC